MDENSSLEEGVPMYQAVKLHLLLCKYVAVLVVSHKVLLISINRGFLTQMVYLYYISCLRYAILVGNPQYDSYCDIEYM